MKNRIRLQTFFGMALAIAMGACTSDTDSAIVSKNRPLEIKSVTYSTWEAPTRAATYPEAKDKRIWVSANDATPSLYEYNSTENKYKVIQGTPQEWSGVSANVYGFYTSTNANRVNSIFTIADEQDGTEGISTYNFQASEKKLYTWSSENSDGVVIALRQQLARINITVEDGDANTQVLIGNGQLYCQGMFQYTAPAAGAPQFHTEQGYWAFAGISKTMTLTNPSNGNGKSFSAYILPQTVANASHFFRVSNTGTGRSSYYALPNANYSFQAGHQYNCVLMQNMYVSSISIDEDFSNGGVTNVATTSESY